MFCFHLSLYFLFLCLSLPLPSGPQLIPFPTRAIAMVTAIVDLVITYGARVALALVLVIVVRFLHEMLKVRLLFYRLRKQGLVCPHGK